MLPFSAYYGELFGKNGIHVFFHGHCPKDRLPAILAQLDQVFDTVGKAADATQKWVTIFSNNGGKATATPKALNAAPGQPASPPAASAKPPGPPAASPKPPAPPRPPNPRRPGERG